MDEWTSFSQVAFTFIASNYRRHHTQHPGQYADIKNRRHTNLQSNLQYIAYVRGLQTILIVEKIASNYLLYSQDIGSCQTTTVHSECESNANQFWTRLMKEYLPTLRPQSKWHTTKDPIMKGQVVWILENNSPRGLWPLGLVTEVYPGSDNIVRKCKLKTKTGETVKSAPPGV